MSHDSGFMGLLTGDLSRFLFALPFGAFGAAHFMQAKSMTGMVPAFVPGPPIAWVYITGGAMLLAALAFLTGKFTFWAGVGLGVMLLGFAFTVHLPTYLGEDATAMVKQIAMGNMLKDIALAGAAFYIGGKAAI